MFRKYSWKPVEIDGSLFSGGTEDLIGIEECTDYELSDLVLTTKVKLTLVCFVLTTNISCSSLLFMQADLTCI